MKNRFLLLCAISFALRASAQGDDPTNADFAAYNNFDFIPGKKVCFFDDFTSGLSKWHVIEFDASDDVESPGIKQVSNDEQQWFKMPRRGIFYPKDVTILPEEFTIEFDMWADLEKMSEMEGGLALCIVSNKTVREDYSMPFDEHPQIQLDIHPSLELLYCIATKGNVTEDRVLAKKQINNGWNMGESHHISISRNKTHINVFVNEKKFIDLPNGLPVKDTYTLIMATNLWGDGLYMTNFKIAEGISDQISAMNNEGKFVTNAIHFNVNSATIKPESWPALNQAATAIKASQGKIVIIGHTDSNGNSDANLTLSKKRAESVKQALIDHFGIDESRLSTDGKGEAEPIDSNDTDEGKANNRRVEFVIVN